MIIGDAEFQDIFTFDPKEHYIFKKFTQFDLGENLKLSEFQCKCRYDDCHFTIIYSYNIECYNQTRLEFGFPVTINSGFRCQRHNLKSGGVLKSDHTKGEALDLVPIDFDKLDELEKIARKHYKAVIRYPRFIHCSN